MTLITLKCLFLPEPTDNGTDVNFAKTSPSENQTELLGSTQVQQWSTHDVSTTHGSIFSGAWKLRTEQ